jgi:hypothetical protein
MEDTYANKKQKNELKAEDLAFYKKEPTIEVADVNNISEDIL